MIKSTGFTKTPSCMSGSDRRRSELADSNITSINNLNYSQGGQQGH